MLSYWILRDLADAAVGLVRVENDRVLLTTAAAQDVTFRLFSDGSDAPILPCAAVQFQNAAAVLGTQNGTLVAYALSPQAKPLSFYQAHLSRIRTIAAVTEDVEPITEQPQAEEAGPVLPEPEAPEEPEAAKEEPEPAEEPEIEEPPAQPDPPPAPISLLQANSAEGSDVSDTARATEAFSRMLQRANAFYARFETFRPAVPDQLVQKEDNQPVEERGIDLLPQLFPGARWRYVDGANMLGHFEGDYRYPNGARIRILAVRGKSAPRPPRTLAGFTRFVRAPDGVGYWIKIE